MPGGILFRTFAIAVVLLVAASRAVLADQAPIASAVVDNTSPGRVIPTGFVGLSHEWTDGTRMMASPTAGSNAIYRQLILNLLDAGSGPMLIRIGGNSTDATGEPPVGLVAPFAQLYSDLNIGFALGVNLGSNDPALARNQAQAYVHNMPSGSLQAIEIGNEPDLYSRNGHRSSDYGFDQYVRDFNTWRAAIQPVLPRNVKLLGPAWARLSELPNLPRFLETARPALGILSQHWYAGTKCSGRTNPGDYLLRASSSTSGATAVAPAIAVAHKFGLPFRIGEMNSISCGGEQGVSDVFASALWLADSLFEFANAGVDGVNIHTGNGGAYALFAFGEEDGAYTLQYVRPEYYGLLLFQLAAPAGSRLLPVSLATNANVKVWATIDDVDAIRVLVINKDESDSGSVSIQIPVDDEGELTRLEASGFDAQSGIALGGQTFDSSTDGTLQGAPVIDAVVPSDGAYTFSVPASSAALLKIPRHHG